MSDLSKFQPQLIKEGDKFGKLTVVECDPRRLERGGPSVLFMWAECSCECGNVVKILINSLLAGIETNCGCESPFGDMSEEDKEWCDDLISKTPMNYGMALSYRRRDFSIEQSTLAHNRFIVGTRPPFKGKRRNVNKWLQGFIGIFQAYYVGYTCECGAKVFFKEYQNKMVTNECRCDLFHDKVTANPLKLGRPMVINRKLRFDRTKCHKPMCMHYNGDGGCLDQLADGLIPLRFKSGFKCHEVSEPWMGL